MENSPKPAVRLNNRDYNIITADNELLYIILICGHCISFLIKNWTSQTPSKPENSDLKIVLISTERRCLTVCKYLKQ